MTCGYLIRVGRYAHVLTGSRRVEVDARTGWVTRLAIEASDDAGRRFETEGAAVSRHWKGHGGDTLMRWSWDGVTGYGEDQSYFSKTTWQALKKRSIAIPS